MEFCMLVYDSGICVCKGYRLMDIFNYEIFLIKFSVIVVFKIIFFSVFYILMNGGFMRLY